MEDVLANILAGAIVTTLTAILIGLLVGVAVRVWRWALQGGPPLWRPKPKPLPPTPVGREVEVSHVRVIP